MSLLYSMEQANALIRENEKRKRYFTKTISPRFADCIYERRIHFSKLFEFYEMARFDILNDLYEFRRKKTGQEQLSGLGNFVVVRVQCDCREALHHTRTQDITIKTALVVHQKPLLEFEQLAFDEDSGELLMEANIRIAIVDDTFHKAENWESNTLLAILEFINTYGKEEPL